MATRIIKQLLIILILTQVGSWAASSKKVGKPKASGNQANGSVEEMMKLKFKNATPSQLNKYKTEATKRLQASLANSLQAISKNTKDVPADVRTAAKSAMSSVKSGKLNTVMAKSLKTILQRAGPMSGKPGNQLQVILDTVTPMAGTALQAPLKGVTTFVTTNLSGVNTLLGKTLGGAPDLLSGVIKSLVGNLADVTNAVNDSLASFGPLLGGLLNN